MNVFLLALLCIGLLLVTSVLLYQKTRLRYITDEKGDYIDRKKNPLLIKNLHAVEHNTEHLIKKEIREIILGLLKFLLSLKKRTRHSLDAMIYKLAKIAFPEQVINGPIDENKVLLHVEMEKKKQGTGRIE